MAAKKTSEETIDKLLEATISQLRSDVRENRIHIERLQADNLERDRLLAQLQADLATKDTKLRQLQAETQEQGIRFTAYQQATQWVVNLAFALIASGTILAITLAVLR